MQSYIKKTLGTGKSLFVYLCWIVSEFQMKSENEGVRWMPSTSAQDWSSKYLKIPGIPELVHDWWSEQRFHLVSTIGSVARTGMAFGFTANINKFQQQVGIFVVRIMSFCHLLEVTVVEQKFTVRMENK